MFLLSVDVNIIFLGNFVCGGADMKNNRLFGGRKLSVLSSTAISACVGCGAIFVAVLAFAYVITKIDATDLMLSVMSTAALWYRSVCRGICLRKKATLETVCCQVCCAECSFFLSLSFSVHCFLRQAESLFRACKALCLLVCAGVGGSCRCKF